MTSPARNFVSTVLLALGASGCVSVNSVTPDPAHPGAVVRVHLSNVIGPTKWEPGARLKFDGAVMPLDPDTASVVGFVVPEATPDGRYTIEVRDGPGFFEFITIVPLLRFRSASASFQVGPE